MGRHHRDLRRPGMGPGQSSDGRGRRTRLLRASAGLLPAALDRARPRTDRDVPADRAAGGSTARAALASPVRRSSADPRLAPGGRGRQGRPAPRARTDRGRRPGRSRGPGVAGGVPDGLHQRRGGSARPDRRRTAARGAVRPAHRRRAGVHGPGAGDRPAARLSRCRGATGTRTSSRSPAARGLPGHRRGNRQRRRDTRDQSSPRGGTRRGRVRVRPGDGAAAAGRTSDAASTSTDQPRGRAPAGRAGGRADHPHVRGLVPPGPRSARGDLARRQPTAATRLRRTRPTARDLGESARSPVRQRGQPQLRSCVGRARPELDATASPPGLGDRGRPISRRLLTRQPRARCPHARLAARGGNPGRSGCPLRNPRRRPDRDRRAVQSAGRGRYRSGLRPGCRGLRPGTRRPGRLGCQPRPDHSAAVLRRPDPPRHRRHPRGTADRHPRPRSRLGRTRRSPACTPPATPLPVSSAPARLPPDSPCRWPSRGAGSPAAMPPRAQTSNLRDRAPGSPRNTGRTAIVSGRVRNRGGTREKALRRASGRGARRARGRGW